LADTEQVADGVVHLGESCPVLVRVGQRLGDCVVDTVHADGTEQRATEAWLGVADERIEGSVRPHAVRILTPRRPSRGTIAPQRILRSSKGR
jgi:hypothetical protein